MNHHCYQIILSETFLHKSGAVKSVNWIFIDGHWPGSDWTKRFTTPALNH